MARAPRVLLLDPPAAAPVLRDYYCSTRPKTAYRWQPIDLLALTAQLRGRADVLLLDCVAERLSTEAALQRIGAFEPDVVFTLASTLTAAQDLAFAATLARRGCRIVVGGEVALDPRFDFSAHPHVDGLILSFVAPEAAEFLLGSPPTGRIRTASFEPTPPSRGGVYRLGGPMVHEALKGRYQLPLWRRGFHSLLTDFGCIFACSFCNSGRHSIGHALRDIDEVADEVRALSLRGVRRLYIRDMTFGGVREHNLAVLSLLARHRFSLRAFLRADLVDDELADAMAAGGLRVAQLGVEAPTPSARRALGKQLGDSDVERASALLRDRGIAVGAHFVVGGQDRADEEAERCARYARGLGAAYCSINVLQQRNGCSALEAPSGAAREELITSAQRAMMRYNLRAPVTLAAATLQRTRRRLTQ